MQTQSLWVRILAARLRITLDKRLGRDTPKWVLFLAEQTISKGSYQTGWDSRER